MEAGERWILNDVSGKPIRAWDSLGRAFQTEYDELRRPVRSFVKGADAKDPNRRILFERTVYGETHPDSNPLTPGTQAPLKLNLRGKVFMHLDGAGVITNSATNPQTHEPEAHDFKGNLLRSTRRLGKEYKQLVDWLAVEPLLVASPLDLTDIESALSPLIESDFTGSTTYDALNRPITLTTPDNTVIRPKYNKANLLDSS